MIGALTVQDAARATGWSARMLRYIEEAGLVAPARSEGGYRLYRPAEVERLRSLRRLLQDHGLRLDDLGFALRLRRDGRLRREVDAWLAAAQPELPRVQPSPLQWLVADARRHERVRFVA